MKTITVLLIASLFLISCEESVQYESLKIKTLSVNSELSGGFIIGLSETAYYHMYGVFDQGLMLVKIPATKVYILESNEQEPQIVNYYCISDGYKQVNTHWFYPRGRKEMTIIVPENTIIKDYSSATE